MLGYSANAQCEPRGEAEGRDRLRSDACLSSAAE